MLTAKIGESIVNVFDSKFDKSKLKTYSSKGIIKCPVCEGEYEYCHGEIVMPYFRHKSKECAFHYSEPETEEHMMGKKLLYEWIKEQPDVLNCKLEAWIPETKQRPDIYFEQNGIRYVIEYQCTPISSEHIKRRELYELAGIKDIWILGTLKYKVNSKRVKYIQNEIYSNHNQIFHFNHDSKDVNFRNIIYKCEDIEYVKHEDDFGSAKLDEFTFINGYFKFKTTPKHVVSYNKSRIRQYEKRLERLGMTSEEYEESKRIEQEEYRKNLVRMRLMRSAIEKYNDSNSGNRIIIKKSDRPKYLFYLQTYNLPNVMVFVTEREIVFTITYDVWKEKHSDKKVNDFGTFLTLKKYKYEYFNIKNLINIITKSTIEDLFKQGGE